MKLTSKQKELLAAYKKANEAVYTALAAMESTIKHPEFQKMFDAFQNELCNDEAKLAKDLTIDVFDDLSLMTGDYDTYISTLQPED